MKCAVSKGSFMLKILYEISNFLYFCKNFKVSAISKLKLFQNTWANKMLKNNIYTYSTIICNAHRTSLPCHWYIGMIFSENIPYIFKE